MEIDVYQDTVCPWCRIGKANLRRALEQWDGEPVTVRYRTFFLNEGVPPEGYAFAPYMRAKVGGRVPLDQLFEGPRRAGAAAGVCFNFEAIERAPNTLLSHRLVALAPEGRREELLEAVYVAYFEQGRDIGDVAVLLEVAAEQGLDAQAIGERLRGDEAAEELLAEAREAHELGITGVPFFVLNRRYGVSGAQPPEVLLRAMRTAAGG